MESTDKIRNAITEVVESATKRFADATEDMRRTASSIRSELEETRAEIKKGVVRACRWRPRNRPRRSAAPSASRSTR